MKNLSRTMGFINILWGLLIDVFTIFCGEEIKTILDAIVCLLIFIVPFIIGYIFFCRKKTIWKTIVFYIIHFTYIIFILIVYKSIYDENPSVKYIIIDNLDLKSGSSSGILILYTINLIVYTMILIYSKNSRKIKNVE